jgi:hypothetical protein
MTEGTAMSEPWDGVSYSGSPQQLAWERAMNGGPIPDVTEQEAVKLLAAILEETEKETPMQWCARVLSVDPSTAKVDIDQLQEGRNG